MEEQEEGERQMKSSKMLKGPGMRYAGFPGLLHYSLFHGGNPVPSAETLQLEIEKLDRYIATKENELDVVIRVKRKIEENPLGMAGEEMGPTLRMVFRRTEIQLRHDITELKSEHDMVHNALTELPRFWNGKKNNDKQNNNEDQARNELTKQN